MLRDVRGADPVAVGDGGQSLDVPPEQPGEHLGLCFAELGKLGCNVGDRAVMLAQLVADGCGTDRGSVPVLAQGLGKHLDLVLGAGRLDGGAVTVLELGRATPSELGNRVGTARLAQEPQRTHGQVVVRLGERVTTEVGEHEHLRRSTTPTGAGHPRLACFNRAVSHEVIQMAPDRGRRELQPLGQGRRRGGPVLENGAGDPLTRGSVVEYSGRDTLECRERSGGRRVRGCQRVRWLPHVFHNTIVS